MNPIKLMQSIATSNQLSEVKGVALKPGQLVHGRVEKLFPQNVALIRIGSLKMSAHIEVALKVMENYWFEVVGNQNDDVLLKVIENKNSRTSLGDDYLRSLLQQFSLTDSKQNMQLLQFLLSKNIPFTKENLRSASQLLRDTKDMTKGLAALEQLIKKEIPISEGTFKAMHAVQGGNGISAELSYVSNLINSNKLPQSETINQLKSVIASLKGELTLDETKKVISELIKVLVTDPTSKKTAAFQLLQGLGMFPVESKPSDSISSFSNSVNLLQSNQLDTFAKQVTESFPQDALMRASKVIGNMLQSGQSKNEDSIPLLKQVVEQIKTNTFNFDSGSEVKRMMKSILSTLGLEHESRLGSLPSESVPVDKLSSLKPLLLKAMNEMGAMGKELEPLLNKLTGIQLLSHEQNSPMQQIMMHIPLLFGTKQSELTLQWNGRKDKDGKIDPGFCRILFYLDLEHIHETVIDMQVQNKVVTITLINESTGLESIVHSFQAGLREQLAEMNYKLSNIRVVTQEENSKVVKQELTQTSRNSEVYRGVDLKI